MIAFLSPKRRQKKCNNHQSNDAKHIQIPPSTHTIETAAFADHLLQTVSLPNTISTIGRYAFRCCTALKSIYIPSSVTLIDYGAFMGCTSLSSLNIPPSVSVIQKFAFSHCTSLVSVSLTGVLPSSVSSPSLSLSNTELQIYPAAFSNCTSLISIAIGNNCTFLTPQEGYDARNPPPFGQCTQLEKIHKKHYSSTTSTTVTTPTTTNAPTNINTWLKHRFENLPLHELCYNPNVTIEQIQSVLSTSATTNHHNSNDEISTFSLLSSTDLLDMTPLHVLCCNPNVTPKMITYILDLYSDCINNDTTASIESLSSESTIFLSLQSMEASNKRTPLELFLSCHGCLSFDLFVNNNHRQQQQSQQYHDNDNNRSRHFVTLEKAFEQGLKWHIIEIILSFQKESTIISNTRSAGSNSNTNTSNSNLNDDEDTNNATLHPFMKAATLSQCELNLVYHLALLYGIEYLISL